MGNVSQCAIVIVEQKLKKANINFVNYICIVKKVANKTAVFIFPKNLISTHTWVQKRRRKKHDMKFHRPKMTWGKTKEGPTGGHFAKETKVVRGM